MFSWSKKITKSVTFDAEIADESLLEVVETELVKQPHKTFSDLCKEALWQFLCVPESLRPSPKTVAKEQQNEQLVADIQKQLTEFEQRFFARSFQRLEALETKLQQLNQQVAQLQMMQTQPVYHQPPTPTQPEPVPVPAAPPPPPEEVDPLLSRLGAFIDDF